MLLDRETRSSEYLILAAIRTADVTNVVQFLTLLSSIAETTVDNEPRTQAYAWFRSAEDNDAVPKAWVRGFEA